MKFVSWLHGSLCGLALVLAGFSPAPASSAELDAIVARTNKSAGITTAAQGIVDDPTFLRRIYVDLIGRIPTSDEVMEFAKWPVAERRAKLVDKLLQDPRFADRWTIFYADMLRMRSQAAGGQAMIAWVHQAVESGMPYDEMCRRLIYTNGKANKTPEAGFVLGDNADPLALASVTSQVFLGIRMGCAQCHDHPFDVWKRRDFYDLAAFFGRTRRYESQLTRVIYATEMDKSVILWPPEGDAPDDERKIIPPKFPFAVDISPSMPQYVARLAATRKAKAEALAAAQKGPSLDDLLESTSEKVAQTTKIGGLKSDGGDTKTDIRQIDIAGSLYKRSEYREDLASQITDPRNRYFSRALVNRVWKELIGRGFVEPVDDFREDNPPAHPQAMDYLAEEFVASDFDLRTLVRMIVTSEAYQRAHAPSQADQLARHEMEVNLLATPMRRMIAESLFDSIIVAGRLFTPKHSPGKNEKVLIETVRVPKAGAAKAGDLASLTGGGAAMPAMAGMSGPMAMSGGGYALETAIEVDFSAVLKDAAKEDEVAVEQMRVMSREEVEAMRMTREGGGGRMQYETKQVKKVIDDNPVYPSSLRMQSPAPEGHFLRVFGQPNRSDLGDLRDDNASMRQALMMLNGRVTHEAARVGDLEPMYGLLSGKNVDLPAAIKLAYLEILTRRPSAEEMKDAEEIVRDAKDPLDGMADLRWVLLNCNEFRFLP